MGYRKYSLEELEQLISKECRPARQKNLLNSDETVYQKLFDGLDISMLSMMCIQVRGSLSEHPMDDFLSAMLKYADQIESIVPKWKELSQMTDAYAGQICSMISKITDAYEKQDSENIKELTIRLKQSLNDFKNASAEGILSLQNQQNNLSDFITAELSPAVADQSKWIDTGLEKCLSNDKFINGTEASIYNGGTLFSFVIFMQQQSIQILEELKPSWSMEEIVFTTSGQTQIWEIIYKVSLRLSNVMKWFHYIHPYLDVQLGGNSMDTIKDDSAQDMLKTVEKVCVGVQLKGAQKSKLAHQMLRLMNGDAGVLEELPSLNAQPKKNAPRAEADLNGLKEETSGSSINDSRGLLGLTKENIIDVKTFVKTGLGLKTTEEEEAKELGYAKDSPFSKDHPKFAPAEFAKFNLPFHDHAKKWNNLEQDIIQQGNNIQTYGTSFVSHAKFVLEQINKMSVCQSVEDTKITDPNDKKTLSALSLLLDKWKEETNKHSDSTTNLLNRLKDYQNTLVNTLMPSARNMAKNLEELNIEQESKDLQAKIKSLTAEIDAKQKEYNMDCGLANTGAAGIIGGPLVVITWAVTGGIYGAKAERVRKQLGELKKQLKEAQTLYNELNRVAANVHKTTSGIENLNLAITNAVIGLESLNAVWGLITSYISEAKDALADIDTKSMLIEFSYDLENAKASWENVPSLAGSLLALFKEAAAEVNLHTAYESFFENLLQENAHTLCGDTADQTIWDDKYAELCKIVIKTDSEHMPVLYHKAQELRIDAIAVYTAMGNLKNTVLAKGKVLLQKSDPSLLDLLAEKVKKNPSDKDAETAFNYRIERLKKDSDVFLQQVADIEDDIHSNTDILSKNTRMDLGSIGFYTQLNSECKRFAKAIQAHTQLMISSFIEPMQTLAGEMITLDTEINEKIDPENIIKNFKEFLPSEEEVSDMISAKAESKEAKELAAIKLIYSTMLKSLDILAGTITLCKKIEERSRLATKLNNLRKEFEEVDKKHSELLEDEEDLKELLKLPQTLRFFGDEGQAKLHTVQKNRLELAGTLKKIPADYTEYHTYLSQWMNGYCEQ